MKKIEEKAIAFAKSVWEDYLINRDLLKLTKVFDDNASYIGTGDGEICYSLEQVHAALLGEEEEWNGHFTIDDQWYEARIMSDTLVVVFGGFDAHEASDNPLVAAMHTRFSLILRVSGDTFKVVHLHHSVPNFEQLEGEFFPKTITEKRNEEFRHALEQKTNELRRLAQLDSLTGLLNRVSAEQEINTRLEQGVGGVLMMIDIDDFKEINDVFGHLAGDTVLKVLSDRIRQSFGGQSVMGRVGGDEFVVFAQKTDDHESIRQTAQQFCESVVQPVMDIPECRITVSIGIALAPDNGNTYSGLIRSADLALYKRKKNSKNGYVFAG
ncbi:diguanylate cyclase [Eubacterium sp. 1001713B170207_170306_E7]|uniref:GGDEF domain-containing protein n=1 Tax=Eubacterium sp. 1001713B170207_170306_E7 TaxID=2787097 RepID=UPI00189AC862|nr:diguanylate cyclase [Eubacterium sp. 1001713B170207_170306_E7]